jgi:hypothetical protein
MFKKIILVLVILVVCGLAINALTVSPAQAQNSIVDPGNPHYASGDYTLNDILLVGIGVSRWILGIVGALALAMFIYGGVIFLISGGSSEKIGQARKIIVAAVVGLIIVFASYIIIQFVLKSLGLNWQGTNQKMTPTTTSFIINRS